MAVTQRKVVRVCVCSCVRVCVYLSLNACARMCFRLCEPLCARTRHFLQYSRLNGGSCDV